MLYPPCLMPQQFPRYTRDLTLTEACAVARYILKALNRIMHHLKARQCIVEPYACVMPQC